MIVIIHGKLFLPLKKSKKQVEILRHITENLDFLFLFFF